MRPGILLDIDGVLVTSWRALPGAVEALDDLAARGVPRMFLTNTTSKPRRAIAEALDDAGFAVEVDEILTAARLTAHHLAAAHPGKRVWVLNDGAIDEDLDGLQLTDDPDDAEVIVLGGAGPPFTHETVSLVLTAMLDGVPVIAMHRSLTWATDTGIKADTGVYLPGLEKAAGQQVRAIGKPSPLGFRLAAELMGMDPSQVLMVGDDLHGDVLGGQAASLIGVLVRTGKFRQTLLDALGRDDFAPVPDHIIDSVAELPGLVASVAAESR